MTFTLRFFARISLLICAAAGAQSGTPNNLAATAVSTSVLTANGTTASASFVAFTTNSLVMPALPPNTTRAGECDLVWQQSASTSDTPRLGLNTSTALTGLWIKGSQFRNATGTVVNQLPSAVVSTATTTGITASMTPAAINTSYQVHVDFSVQTDSSHTEVITVFGLTTGGTLTLVAGSSCTWLP